MLRKNSLAQGCDDNFFLLLGKLSIWNKEHHFLKTNWNAEWKKKSQWLFEIIRIIHFEMHMDRPDKFENIFGRSY